MVQLKVIQGGATDYVQDVFGERGYLARYFKGYRPRPGQIQLARAIDRAIVEGAHLIGEGPTGTGKSLAYSVPAVYHAVFNAKRVLIVTANKTLQAQIVNKDLKDLQQAVPWQFTYAVRKGISSYLCVRNHRDRAWEDEDPEAVEDTVQWADLTATGDYEDSPGPPHKVWSHFSTTNDECDGPRRCRHRADCFVIKAKAAAESASIVVTNYHLLYRHLNYAASGKPGSVLPPFDIAILDEAHNAANIARDFLGEDASIGFQSVYRCVAGLHTAELLSLRSRAEALRNAVLDEAKRFWSTLKARPSRVFEKPDDCASHKLEVLLLDTAELYTRLSESLSLVKGSSVQAAQYGATAAKHLVSAARCTKVAEKLANFREMRIKGLVYFIDGGDQVRLRAKALRVGGYLRQNLFLKTPSVIQTSATLAVKGGGRSDFDYVKREMGMQPLPNVHELTVPSPFDWPKQALLVVPEDMPEYEYGNDAFDRAVEDRFEDIVRMVRGRTMGLFTSFRLMERVGAYLRTRQLPYNVLMQREGTNRDLQQRFKSDVSSVLLGTQSFAEGVDIQGEACTCVVLDKINFTPKDDPVMVGLARTDKQVFNNYSVPEAIINFKQRLGRLIRSVNDVGVVVVLDRRLLTKSYGQTFFSSIPPMRVSRTLADIEPFLHSVGGL